jgi:hypothetical protein
MKRLKVQSLEDKEGDTTRLWNNAPDGIKISKTITGAKNAIKMYCKYLLV